jgi:class 3 adenylate cyclase/tetratricopeptide (TPR) repeat protein
LTQPDPSPGAGDAERRLAILFTDVEGSTQLRATRGDVAADEILGIHESIVRRQLAEHGGEEVLFMGDGFLASFPTVPDAIASAIAIQRGLAERNREDPDRQVRVRIGLHTGDVTARGGTLYGQAVNAASRIADAAAGGQILGSSAIRDAAAEAAVAFRDRGLFWLKGFPQRWRLHELEWGGEAPAQQLGLAPLVEREEELADLRRAVDEALAGRGSLVLLAGQAGMGKTRLTQEVDAEAERRGMRVLVGHCTEEGTIPYLPFVELFEAAFVAPRSPASLRDALGDAAPEIARMVPSLRRVMPDLAPPVDLPPDQARRFLWVSVQEVLERAGRSRPLLLVLEDLHWADESTIALLEHLAPALADLPVLILGTYRDVEVGAMHPLAQMIGLLGRRRLVTRITLDRLTGSGVAALVRGIAGHEPPAQLVRVIHSESEGNPFFIEEVFLHLREAGKLLDEQGRFRPDVRVEAWEVPETIRLVIEQRLARLSDQTREVLVAAATSGRSFEIAVVARAAGVKPDRLTAALDEAEGALVIAPAEAGGTRHSFTHELIRQTFLAGASSVKRQLLHARTAEAIELVHPNDLEERAADLVYHLSRSGPGASRARLGRYLRMAGEHAARASAFDDAVTHFEQALVMLGDEERGERAELLERLALALRSVGRWEDAVRVMDQALDLFEALGRTDAIGRLGWTMVYHLAWSAKFEEAVALSQRALAALGDAPNPDRGRLVAAAAWAISLSGDHGTSTGTFEQARELVEAIGDERALADVLHMETIHHLSFGEFSQGIESGLRAAKVFEAQAALWDLASVLSFVGYEAGTIPRVDVATENVARAAPLAERLGHLGAEFMTLAARVRVEGVMAGDIGVVEKLGRRMVEVCERGGLPWLYVGHMHIGLAAHWRGEPEEAERGLRLAMQLEPPAAFAGQSASLLAIHLASAGRVEDAVALVEEMRPMFPVEGRVNTLGSWNLAFGCLEALFIAGRRDEAAALEPLVLDALEHRGEWITFDCRLTRTRAAIAAHAAGRLDDADERYRLALAAAEELSLRLETTELRRFLGELLLERGRERDRDEARRLLADAAEAYASMGMPVLEARARSLPQPS